MRRRELEIRSPSGKTRLTFIWMPGFVDCWTGGTWRWIAIRLWLVGFEFSSSA